MREGQVGQEREGRPKKDRVSFLILGPKDSDFTPVGKENSVALLVRSTRSSFSSPLMPLTGGAMNGLV